MKNKVVMITGATNGIGLETARKLAHMEARIVMVGRNPEKTTRLADELKRATDNPNIDTMIADLSLQTDIRKLASEFESRYDRLDVLINNAGGFFNSKVMTEEGFEMTFALNHLNYFLLTNLLLDILKDTAPARVINVSSGAHFAVKELDFDNLQGEKGYNGWRAYSRSKLENVMFTYELARRVENDGITANVLHPGFVDTGFGMNNGWLLSTLTKISQRLFAMSPEEGAETPVYLASSPEVEGVTGKYWDKSKAVKSSQASYQEADWARLWDISAQMTGLKTPQTAW